MSSSPRVRALLATAVAASLAALVLHGCSEQPTEPISLAVTANPVLPVGAGSGTPNGRVTSDHGGINCSITGSTGGASTSGKCSATKLLAGTVVTLTATPAIGAILKLDQEWQGCVPDVSDRRICRVTLSSDVTVAPTFV